MNKKIKFFLISLICISSLLVAESPDDKLQQIASRIKLLIDLITNVECELRGPQCQLVSAYNPCVCKNYQPVYTTEKPKITRQYIQDHFKEDLEKAIMVGALAQNFNEVFMAYQTCGLACTLYEATDTELEGYCSCVVENNSPWRRASGKFTPGTIKAKLDQTVQNYSTSNQLSASSKMLIEEGIDFEKIIRQFSDPAFNKAADFWEDKQTNISALANISARGSAEKNQTSELSRQIAINMNVSILKSKRARSQ